MWDEMILQLLDIGRIDFQSLEDLQRKLAGLRASEKILDALVLLENEEVYTVGVKQKDEEIPSLFRVPIERVSGAGDVLFRVPVKENGSVKFVPVIRQNRGGSSTYLGPGQVVGFPIVDFAQYNSRVHSLPKVEVADKMFFMQHLEEVLIRTLREYGINTFRRSDYDPEAKHRYVGVWYDSGHGIYKIAGIALNLKPVNGRFVTQYGFALNVKTDLDKFYKVHVCGREDLEPITMEGIIGNVDYEGIKKSVVKNFKEVFGYEGVERIDLNFVNTLAV